MARFISVNAEAAEDNTSEVAAKVRLGNKFFDILPGEIHKGIQIPCEVYRLGSIPVKIVNTTKDKISIGPKTISPKKSYSPQPNLWTKVG